MIRWMLMLEKFHTPVKIIFGVLATLGSVASFFVWYGVKPQDVAAWPRGIWLFLSVSLFVGVLYVVFRSYTHWAHKRAMAENDRKIAYSNLVLALHLSKLARELKNQLEEIWHSWNNAGDTFSYPFTQVSKLTAQRPELQQAAQNFRVRYFYYAALIPVCLPEATSPVTEIADMGFANYIETMRILDEHIEKLKDMATWYQGESTR